MKKLSLLLVAIFACLIHVEAKTIKIACIGDSITAGAGITNNKENAYPVLFSKMMGEGYEIRNFGMGGRSMLYDTDRAYVNCKHFPDVLKFKPDIVTICLGTNDSKTYYRDIVHNFERDYKRMIETLRKELPRVRIVLLTPPMNHNPIEKYQIDHKFITSDIVPTVRKIAYDEKLEIIDMYHLFADHKAHFMPDGVHPSALGAAFMSTRLYEYFMTPYVEFAFDAKLADAKCFNGFDSYDFEFKGKKSTIVIPRVVGQGQPWLLKDKPIDSVGASADIAFLERGFHLVYTESKDMAAFCKNMIKKGLCKDLIVQRGDVFTLVYALGKQRDIYTEPIGIKTYDIAVMECLKAYNRFINPAAVPTPGAEYRGGADWYNTSKEIDSLAQANKYDILFLGNSITQHMGGGERNKVKQTPTGEAVMVEALKDYKWLNAGISGDRTEHLLYRIQNGYYEQTQAKYVFMNIGINNFNAPIPKHSAEQVIEGVVACAQSIAEKMPQSKIFIFGTLPAQKNMADCKKVAEAMKKQKWSKNVTYIDPYPVFTSDGENVIESLYSKDKLHLGAEGYKVWSKMILEQIK